MKSLTKMAALAGLLAALSASASARGHIDRNRPAFASAWKLVVGSGAEYQCQLNGRNVSPMEVSIVGSEPAHGQTGYWVEFFAPGNTVGQGPQKSLIFPEPDRVVFTRTIVQVPGYGAMELPGGLMAQFAVGEAKVMAGYLYSHRPQGRTAGGTSYPETLELAHEWEGVPKAEEIGTETVTTPAGTFLCQHWQFSRHRGDVWVSKGAGPFGLVKALLVDNRTHITQARILERVFTDAQDKIVTPLRPYKPDKLIPHLTHEQLCALAAKLGFACPATQ